MKKKVSLTLDDEFIMYCEMNNIQDIEKLAKETFNRGYFILKYGEVPVGFSSEKIIEKEVIKEVPFEVIKEVFVEKIIEKEVPVDKIVEKEVIVEKIVEVVKEVQIEVKGDERIITKEVIKEIPVEKIVEVFNTEENEKLKNENESLKKELDTIKQSLEKFSKGRFMKDSNLSSLYDE